jgi:catalase
MTQNLPPGIDTSNDPLLQGRNFSYLDTQLKRLGSTNFTHIPINAPKCPMHHFQQDGHMAMRNPVGRANYQPNSWGQGPREAPAAGFRSFRSEDEQGPKARLRPESFADHYSQARQFYRSQQPVEQRHIAMALGFELSKVETAAIRERMVAHLLNIDTDLAATVARELGVAPLPDPADPAVAPVDLPASPALSILSNAPGTFEGRKLGVLVGPGSDAGLIDALRQAFEAEGATVELVAPRLGGVEAAGGGAIAANHIIDGGPSVLFDAVAIVLAEDAAAELAGKPTARAFAADAFAHAKFMGVTPGAQALLDATGVQPDGGVVALEGAKACAAFVERCRALRFWEREDALHR